MFNRVQTKQVKGPDKRCKGNLPILDFITNFCKDDSKVSDKEFKHNYSYQKQFDDNQN